LIFLEGIKKQKDVLTAIINKEDPTIQTGLSIILAYTNRGTPKKKANRTHQKTPRASNLSQYKLKRVGTTTHADIVLNIHHKCFSPNPGI
jgi:ribosomal protein S30